MPSATTQQIRDLKQQVVNLLEDIKKRQAREDALIKRLAGMTRARK